ncbi:hypothetical protein [Nocardia sp. NPDC058666]|uniref:hypothetical protein n=1 Tax=Nocardia sp. NPDC058666 TaxID=3346587 RepID=UPI00364E01F6
MIDPYLLLWALPRGRRYNLAHFAYGLGVMISLAIAVMAGIDVTGMDQPCYGQSDVIMAPGPPAMAGPPVVTTTELADPPVPCYMFCNG